MQNEHLLSEEEMQRKGRKVFLLMLTFFVVPIIVVIIMYQLNWKPQGASRGELVKPAHLLTTPENLSTEKGEKLAADFWKDKWSVVYIANECTQICMQKLSDMRQLHVSLYKDIERTKRVLITHTKDTSEIKSKFPDLVVVNQSASGVATLSQEFSVNQEDALTSGRLYIVDPLGHFMMSYQKDVPLADVRKDITRLLRYSWAG